jgi:hypothetical protein
MSAPVNDVLVCPSPRKYFALPKLPPQPQPQQLPCSPVDIFAMDLDLLPSTAILLSPLKCELDDDQEGLGTEAFSAACDELMEILKRKKETRF